MGQPAHDQLIAPKELHPVDAQIHALFFGAAGDHEGPGDQGADIVWPAGLNGQRGEVDLFAAQDDLLARRLFDHIGPHGQNFFEERRLVDEVFETLGWVRLPEIGQQFAHLAKRFNVFLAHT